VDELLVGLGVRSERVPVQSDLADEFREARVVGLARRFHPDAGHD
jgi:hypothetical protein